ncbi:MAG: MFS transporter [Planctomycetota bacterium]
MFSHYLQLPGTVHLLCLGSFLNRAGSFVLVFLTIYASERLGFGVMFAAFCGGMIGVGGMIGSLIGGQLADTWGRRPVMLMALFGTAAFLILLSTISNRWLFLITLGLMTTVADMYRPAASAMIGDMVREKQRSYAFALMYIAINLGFALAPPLGGWMAQYDFKWLFYIDAATTALFGCVILVGIEDTKASVGDVVDSDREPGAREPDGNAPNALSSAASNVASNASSSAGSEGSMGILPALGVILADGQFMLFCLGLFLLQMVFAQGFTTLPLYLVRSGYTELQTGAIVAINGVLIVLLQLPVTHWLNNRPAISVMFIGAILIGFGFCVNAWSTALPIVLLCIVMFTLGEILHMPFTNTFVTSLAPAKLRARYLGVSAWTFALAIAVGSPVGGSLLQYSSPRVLWVSCGVVSMIAIVLYGIVRSRLLASRPAMAGG